jgi:hypothetical protein
MRRHVQLVDDKLFLSLILVQLITQDIGLVLGDVVDALLEQLEELMDANVRFYYSANCSSPVARLLV